MCDPEQPQKDSPSSTQQEIDRISGKTEQQGEQIRMLGEVISMLGEKLGPVLADPHPVAASESGDPRDEPGIQCQLGGVLRDLGSAVESNSRHLAEQERELQSLLERIQL